MFNISILHCDDLLHLAPNSVFYITYYIKSCIEIAADAIDM